ncbi:MAG: hypothetical protein KY475_21660 [Planctomycetes bacterium]|nr:hypothetical protein [Planctomycetota bacterium]
MLEYRRLRAPSRDGEALIDPPFAAAGAILAENAARLRDAEVEIAGRPLAELAAEARRRLLEDAGRYTSAYRAAPAVSGSRPILLAGHQPLLFHPGVLFKNFAMSAWGREFGAAAINLIIDNDAAGAPSIRVPTGSLESPRLGSTAFDEPSARMPYEERRIVDREIFRSFGRRVAECIRPLIADPIVNRLWPYATQAGERSENLGRCLAEARHRLEGDWGLETLELPLSEICRTAPFTHFIAHLLADLPRFCDVHNDALREYRRVNRLRSRTHPVPDLAAEGEWREAPLWVWSQDDPMRRRLFARRSSSEEVELTDRGAWSLRLPLPKNGAARAAVERLMQLDIQGIRLRTRALTTTLYARLFLGDAFLHGVGGAKYDQLTDALIQRFFGAAPPTFFAVTATVRLPIDRPAATQDDLRRVGRQLRELRYHPEQYLDNSSPEAAPHVEQKRRWIAADPPPGARRDRHIGIEQANAALQPFVEKTRRRLEQERRVLSEEVAKAQLLGSREFSFCLYPQDYLPSLLHQLTGERRA